MKINLSNLCLSLLLAVNVVAHAKPASPAATPTESDQDKKLPVYINADKAYFNYKTGTSMYTGHVIATHGDSILTGDKMTSYRDHNTRKIGQIITVGKPATMTVKDSEHPTPTHGTAATITMYPEQHTVVLAGDAKASQGSDLIHGPKISYNTQTGVMIAESNAQQKTHIFINNDTDSSDKSKTGALS